MDFRILGPPQVIDADNPVPIGGRKEQALLALLVVNANRSVSVDRMEDELWGDDPPRTSTKTLRSYISRLRNRLGPGITIETLPGGYELSLDSSAVDAGRFEEYLESGLAKQCEGSHVLAAEDLAAALGEWRGPALAGFEDYGFAQLEAARLEARRFEALEARITSDLELGRHRRLVAELEQLVAMHPLHEAFWRLLMLALYRSGRQGDALRVYQEVRKRLGDQLGIEPSPELNELEEQILLHDARLTPTVDDSFPLHNLPEARDSFIGRDDELAEIHSLLADFRCVTLTGVGGVGKTRLGIEAARRALQAHPDGTRWVELATITDPESVVEQVLFAFGEPGSHASDPARVLVDILRPKQLLVVLDNCEHLVDPIAELADRLLDGCPRLGILATSRETLGIAGEAVFHVPTLAVPAPEASIEEVSETEAVRLFSDRIAAHNRAFMVDEDNAALVATVCRKLDGIPLAIELAAGRARTMPIADLVQHLDHRLGLLTKGTRTAPPRQRTLRSTIGWSYDLLTPDAKKTLARLGVFVGPWTIADTAAVVTEGDDPEATRSLLEELVDKSLIEPTDNGRFRMLETVREFAFEQLVLAAEAPDIGRRHRDRYLDVARTEDPRLRGREQREAWGRLEEDHDNLRAAVQWSLDNGEPDGALELVAALGYFWMVRGYWREAWRWLERGLSAPDASGPARARAILGEAILEVIRVNVGAVRELLAEARDAFEAASDYEYVARVEALQAVSAAFATEEDAVALLRHSYEHFVTLGDSWWVAFVARYLGAEQSHAEDAVRLLQESAERFHDVGDLWSSAFSVYYLSGWYLGYGYHEEGKATASRARDLASDVGDVVWHAHALRNLGIAAHRVGDYTEARENMQRALDRLQLIGDDACTITLNGMLATLDVADGDARAAVRRITEAMRCAQRLGPVQTSALALLRAAQVASAVDEADLSATLAAVAVNEIGAAGEQFSWLRDEIDETMKTIEAAGHPGRSDQETAPLSVEEAVAATLEWCLTRVDG